jgi:hypothetical protein
MTPIGCDVELFIALCAIDNKLEKIVSATPPFAVSAPLLVSMHVVGVQQTVSDD